MTMVSPGPYLHHFSEDGSISRFVPHVPKTNPGHTPAVWAIDSTHAPLYWFPRNCPRVAVWPGDEAEQERFGVVLGSTSSRVHAIEFSWLERMTSVDLFQYDFAIEGFEPWPEASGQWVAEHDVEPVSVTSVGDLFKLHKDAGIELRLVSDLGGFADLVKKSSWEFSVVRLANGRQG